MNSINVNAAAFPLSTSARSSQVVVHLESAGVTFARDGIRTVALDNTSLKILDGEFVALVGPSGCGKSTILRLIAGLLDATDGHVFVGDREVGASSLRVGMAFQNPTMLPWMSVRQNVMLPLKIASPFREAWRTKKRTEYRERADRLLQSVGLLEFADHRPWQLSGGMQQRASLCRALIHEPRILLLDEPFGALDQFTKEELWDSLQDLFINTRPTVVMVTHDLRESLYLADRIVVMSARPGRVIHDYRSPFGRPRTPDITYRQEFTELSGELRARIARTENRLDAK